VKVAAGEPESLANWHLKRNRRIPSVLSSGLVLAAILTVACRKGPSGPPPGPAEVSVVTVQPERIVLTTELPGRTSPYLVAEVRPQVNGLIRERAFEEGSNVKAGDLLYQIDPAPYQAAYDQAKAALAMAEANVPAARLRAERLKGLVEIRATGKQNYDDALAALQQAEASVASSQAAVESARINLAYTPIRAPIPGRIGKSSVTVGALVTAYQPVPLAVIQQLDPIYIDVAQSSAEILRLRQSLETGRLKRSGESWSRVNLLLEDGTAYPLAGKLKFRDVTVDPTTGSVILRMVFPNPDSVLLPGMFVRAIVEEGVSEAAILAPQQGVTRDQKGLPYALLAGKDGKAEQRTLTLDRTIGDRWLVTKGLAAGDRVIVDGLQRIRPGADVKAVPFAPAKTDATAGGQPAAPK
jgi:membrane fusion protein (multidrug efflux system)